MTFYQQPSGYSKTILSDLQGAWSLFRAAIVEEYQTKDCADLIFHIDEAMSWESVRNLNHMKNTFVLIQSLVQQVGVSEDALVLLGELREILYETLNEVKKGKIL